MRKKLLMLAKCNLAALFPSMLPVLRIPRHVANIRLTTRCSGRCLTCTHWRNPPRDELSTAAWKRIFAELRARGFTNVIFTGGDAFLRPDLFELIAACKKQGLRVALVTNAFSIDAAVASELIAASPDNIVVSLDDTTDRLDARRGFAGASERVTQVARMLRSLAEKTPIRIGIAPLIMKETLAAARRVVEFAVANRIPIASLNLIHFTHYFFNNDDNREQYRVDHAELASLLAWLAAMKKKAPRLLRYRLVELEFARDYFRDYRQKRLPCLQTAVKICMDPNGDVRACCSTGVTGNAVTDSLSAAIDGPRHLAQVKKCLKKECPGCSCRHQLTLKLSLRANLREAALRAGLDVAPRRRLARLTAEPARGCGRPLPRSP